MKRFLLFVSLILAFFVAYYFLRVEPDSLKMSKINFRTINLGELQFPYEKVESVTPSVKVTEHRIQIKNYDVFYRKASCHESKRINILLLHGMRFKSETWLNLKTIHYLAALGFDVTAIDLPGYGESSPEQVPESDRGDFLHLLITSLNLAPCVIVSPSLSGSFTIPLIESHPGDFLAFVPIAPIRTNALTPDKYKAISIPTLILRGEKDEELGRESVSNLQQIPTSQIFVIPKAGHAAYLDDPRIFHQVLYNFLNKFKE